ncbi:hypothetical protein AB2M62_06305 [Sphingomonas sp. MMS12-HWE2-04]|uniref:hypothetical protein n=1 Tax=Sphingomonas sp. MMS12-HWE2-04 TaxID=3234199 RepID=UPI00384F0FE8
MSNSSEDLEQLAQLLAGYRNIELSNDLVPGVAEVLRVLKAHADRVESLACREDRG